MFSPCISEGAANSSSGFTFSASLPPYRSASPRTSWGTKKERSEEHTSELQSLMRISYAVFCLKKKTQPTQASTIHHRNTAKLCKQQQMHVLRHRRNNLRT